MHTQEGEERAGMICCAHLECGQDRSSYRHKKFSRKKIKYLKYI